MNLFLDAENVWCCRNFELGHMKLKKGKNMKKKTFVLQNQYLLKMKCPAFLYSNASKKKVALKTAAELNFFYIFSLRNLILKKEEFRRRALNSMQRL